MVEGVPCWRLAAMMREKSRIRREEGRKEEEWKSESSRLNSGGMRRGEVERRMPAVALFKRKERESRPHLFMSHHCNSPLPSPCYFSCLVSPTKVHSHRLIASNTQHSPHSQPTYQNPPHTLMKVTDMQKCIHSPNLLINTNNSHSPTPPPSARKRCQTTDLIKVFLDPSSRISNQDKRARYPRKKQEGV